MIKAIIFDFDGVIVDSIHVKTEAFRILFKNYPEHLLNDIIKFHLDNGGISRFIKFRHIYKEILKEELSNNKFHELCRHFSKLVVEKVIKAPFVEGARTLLEKCLSNYKMFIISGTPESEIKEIVLRKGLKKYFSGIFGSPPTKPKLIKKILKIGCFTPKEVLFIGDSINDFNAAMKTGIFFIARSEDKNAFWLNNYKAIGRFGNFKNVYKFLNTIRKIK